MLCASEWTWRIVSSIGSVERMSAGIFSPVRMFLLTRVSCSSRTMLPSSQLTLVSHSGFLVGMSGRWKLVIRVESITSLFSLMTDLVTLGWMFGLLWLASMEYRMSDMMAELMMEPSVLEYSLSFLTSRHS